MKTSLINAIALASALVFSTSAFAGVVEERSSWDAEMPNPNAPATKHIASDKPTLIFLIPSDCSTACGRMVQQLIYAEVDHPEVKLATGDAKDWEIPAALLPFVIVIEPKCGIVKRLPNFVAQSKEAIDYVINHATDGGAMQPVTRICK